LTGRTIDGNVSSPSHDGDEFIHIEKTAGGTNHSVNSSPPPDGDEFLKIDNNGNEWDSSIKLPNITLDKMKEMIREATGSVDAASSDESRERPDSVPWSIKRLSGFSYIGVPLSDGFLRRLEELGVKRGTGGLSGRDVNELSAKNGNDGLSKAGDNCENPSADQRSGPHEVMATNVGTGSHNAGNRDNRQAFHSGSPNILQLENLWENWTRLWPRGEDFGCDTQPRPQDPMQNDEDFEAIFQHWMKTGRWLNSPPVDRLELQQPGQDLEEYHARVEHWMSTGRWLRIYPDPFRPWDGVGSPGGYELSFGYWGITGRWLDTPPDAPQPIHPGQSLQQYLASATHWWRTGEWLDVVHAPYHSGEPGPAIEICTTGHHDTPRHVRSTNWRNREGTPARGYVGQEAQPQASASELLAAPSLSTGVSSAQADTAHRFSLTNWRDWPETIGGPARHEAQRLQTEAHTSHQRGWTQGTRRGGSYNTHLDMQRRRGNQTIG